MRLYLVQHGDALTKDVDPERQLSSQGRADITRLLEWLVTNDPPEVFLKRMQSVDEDTLIASPGFF
jgi:phosphohistidine phosphatase SixA